MPFFLHCDKLCSIIRRMKRFSSLFTAFLLCLIVMLFATLIVPLASAQTTIANTFTCSQLAILDNVTATTRVIVAAGSTQTVYVNGVATQVSTNSRRLRICNVTFRVKQTATPANFGLTTGTGTNCATGSANFTPQFVGTASTNDTLLMNLGADGALLVPIGKDLCLSISVAVPTQAQILVSYGTW